VRALSSRGQLNARAVQNPPIDMKVDQLEQPQHQSKRDETRRTSIETLANSKRARLLSWRACFILTVELATLRVKVREVVVVGVSTRRC